jgi:(S)-1-phenylethanol dehydrogenase
MGARSPETGLLAKTKTGENADMSTGKRAVVTGGANGIGQAFCKRLAAQGANIVIADIANCSETVGAIKKSGGAAIAVRCDQTSEADVAKLRAAVETELGGCDILVHCAGIYPTAAIDEITFDSGAKFYPSISTPSFCW